MDGEKMSKETMVVGGVSVTGERVGVISSTEPWGELLLSDGTVLRIRWVLTKVLRLDVHGADGKPVYVWSQSAVTDVVCSSKQEGGQA
jgi:hypothetical protein